MSTLPWETPSMGDSACDETPCPKRIHADIRDMNEIRYPNVCCGRRGGSVPSADLVEKRELITTDTPSPYMCEDDLPGAELRLELAAAASKPATSSPEPKKSILSSEHASVDGNTCEQGESEDRRSASRIGWPFVGIICAASQSIGRRIGYRHTDKGYRTLEIVPSKVGMNCRWAKLHLLFNARTIFLGYREPQDLNVPGLLFFLFISPFLSFFRHLFFFSHHTTNRSRPLPFSNRVPLRSNIQFECGEFLQHMPYVPSLQ
jgi:hypothetical protein